MGQQNISFGLSSDPGRFGPDGGARLFNCYAEKAAPDAKYPWLLYCRPGLVEFATLTGGAFRGALELDEVGYVVNGTAVDKVESGGVVTNIGAFAGAGHVFMARNRKSPNPQIGLVSGGLRAYVEGDVVTAIGDTDLPAPVSLDTIGGYVVFLIEDGRYFWTAIDSITSINGADFRSAEANPDGGNCVKTRGQEIILVGPRSVEFHALTGSSRVFERLQNTTLDLGCPAGAAVQSLNGVVIFPASDGTVRRLNGYSPERISTHAVERAIEALADKTTMRAHTFQITGHQFYVLNSSEFSWVCDMATGLWQQWESYQLDRWRAEGSLMIGGKRIVGDYALAKIYELDLAAGDDGGDYLVWRMRTAQIGKYPNRFIADRLALDMKVGVGTATETNPQVLLRTSTDGGENWSSDMNRPLGAQGVSKKVVRFRNLGASGEDGMEFELTVSAAVARCMQGAVLDFTPLNN